MPAPDLDNLIAMRAAARQRAEERDAALARLRMSEDTTPDWDDLDMIANDFAETLSTMHGIDVGASDIRPHLPGFLAAITGTPEPHIIELRDDGWTLQHPLVCRPLLFNCPVNRAAEKVADCFSERGRFECALVDGTLVVGCAA